MTLFSRRRRGAILTVTVASAALASVGLAISSTSRQMGKHDQPSAAMMEKMKMLQAMTPALGYLKAHNAVKSSLELLGGPIKINIRQKGGAVYVALPAKRKLDPYVFGNPKMPRSFGGTPGITGVPPMFRGSEGGKYTELDRMTPFGDKFITMGNASLSLKLFDSSATDAATTEDTVALSASWKDKAGNTYSIKCKKVIAHGMEFPTFGGVVTNHLLHGFTRLGTPLMPTEFAYAAFWGMGQVSKNGEVLDGMRVVHGMLTEYVRKGGYKLAADDEVTPGRQQFHLMVAPFKPNMSTGHFDHAAVKTGFKLPNGMELPFWHVMFENLDIKAKRG